jgi:hypothetical protein
MSGVWGRRLLAVVAVILLAFGVSTTVAASARAAGPKGEVFVVHGIVGETFNVFVDGENVCPDAPTKTIVGPLTLSAGSHRLELRKAGGEVLLTTRFTIKAGTSTDVVAHRKADTAGTPTVTVYPNDTRPIGRGKSRLVVAHVAMAPPADIRVDGKAIFRNVANGESLFLDVPAKTYSVDVVPTMGGDPIIKPVSLTLKKGTLTRVFAIGNPADGTADALVQELPLTVVGAKTPTRVQTGDGGQAALAFVGGGPLSTRTSVAVAVLGLLLLLASRAGAGRAAVAGVGSRHAR